MPQAKCFGSILIVLIVALGTIKDSLAQPSRDSTTETDQSALAEAKKVPIGISNIVLRLDSSDEIGMATLDTKVLLLEHMRSQGFSAVGAESLVFGKDNSSSAIYRIGGTIRELQCVRNSSPVQCRLGIEWEVLHVPTDNVVYTVFSRASVKEYSKTEPSRIAKSLIKGTIDSLLKRDNFQKVITAKSANSQTNVSFPRATFLPCASLGKAMPDSAERVLDATVLLKNSNGFGSGFFISSDGLILTAAHVLTGDSVNLKTRSGKELKGIVVRTSKTADVALLRTFEPLTNQPCLVAKPVEKIAVGGELYVAGAPTAQQLAFSLTRGIVSGTRQIESVNLIQTDAPINSGNSGGPLVDRDGAAIGIVTAKLVGRSVEGIGFAVSMHSALAALSLAAGGKTDQTLLTSSAPLETKPASQLPYKDISDPVPVLDTVTAKDDEQIDANFERDRLDRMRAKEQALASPNQPGYISLLRSGGLVTAVVGGTILISSVAADSSSRDKQHSISPFTTLGGVTLGVGAAAFLMSFPLAPSKPTVPQQPPRSSAVALGVSSVWWQGTF